MTTRTPGKPTPRDSKPRPSTASVVLLTLLLGTMLSVAAWWGITHKLPTEAEQRPVRKITHDSLAPTYTYDGELTIRWYVFTDPDTSVQYLVNDLGGCTPRLDQYGHVIGVQTWRDEDW